MPLSGTIRIEHRGGLRVFLGALSRAESLVLLSGYVWLGLDFPSGKVLVFPDRKVRESETCPRI